MGKFEVAEDTNRDRAIRARTVLDFYQETYELQSPGEYEVALNNLLADLQHLAGSTMGEKAFIEAVEHSRVAYETEAEEELDGGDIVWRDDDA